jgi:O-antigen/teichoic acid export membrane protein
MGFFRDRSSAGKKRVILMASTFITAIANTIALLLIAREMGPEILGTLGFILSFIGLFFFVGDMGNGLTFLKLLDKGYKFKECYSAYLLAKIKLTVILGIISGILIAIYVYILSPSGDTPLHPLPMFLILGYFLLANMAQIWIVSLVAKKKELMSNTYDILESVAKVAMVGGLVWLGLWVGYQSAVLNLTAIYLIAAILGLMVVRNTARHHKRMPVSDETVLAFQETSKDILPFIVLGGLILNLDKVLLWYFSDFETVGLYFGAQRITIFIAASSLAIQGLVGDSIARYIKNGDRQSVSDTLRMTERYITLLAMPVAAFYIFFSHDILVAFLGDEFSDANLTVGLLAAAGLFTALAAPHVLYLIKDEKYQALTVSTGLALVILLMLLGVFLPTDFLPFDSTTYSMNATALALFVSSAVGFVGYRSYTLRYLECRPHPRILAHVFCTGVMVVVLNFVGWYFDISNELQRVLFFAVLGIFIYGVALYLAGEFLRQDYKTFKELTK